MLESFVRTDSFANNPSLHTSEGTLGFSVGNTNHRTETTYSESENTCPNSLIKVQSNGRGCRQEDQTDKKTIENELFITNQARDQAGRIQPEEQKGTLKQSTLNH